MTVVLSIAIVLALVCFGLATVLAMLRLLRGPTAHDRVLALDFIYTNAMLMVLVLGIAHESSMYFEVTLLMALFGFVASTALVKFLLRGEVIE